MGRAGFPLRFMVVRVRPGESYDVEDDLGNSIEVPDQRDDIAVAGWSIPSSDEPKLAGHDRQVVEIELHAPVGEFRAEDGVEIPGEPGVFEVIGRPENFEHGPWNHEWTPGVETVNLRQVRH